MSRIIFIVFMFLIASKSNASDTIKVSNLCYNSTEYNQNVVVCTGQYAYAYHSTNNCPGLSNCKGNLYVVTQEDAIYKYGRKACCRCWQNVGNNCHDDNPDNYSNMGTPSNTGRIGGGGDFLFDALAIASVVLISNEAYFAPIYSLRNPTVKELGKDKNVSIQHLSQFGWAFQFRKNFAHSGLEYGFGYTTYWYRIDNGNSTNSVSNTVYRRFNINYVHDIFYYKLPKRLSIYLGPSINLEGIGGNGGIGLIVGSSYKLADRLKADIRYELTSSTHQFALGLQFLYQKKYLWEK